VTVDELYWQWRCDCPSSSNQGDVRRVLQFVRHVGPQLEASALTTATISAYLDELRSANEGRRRYYENHLVTVRSFINFGVSAGGLPRNPMVEELPIWNNRVKESRPRAMRPETENRPMSLGVAPLSLAERREVAEIEAELAREGISTARPRQLSECPPAGRPCGFASCRHSLLVEIVPIERTGVAAVKLNWPGVDVDALEETCSLHAASRFARRQRTFPINGRLQVLASTEEVGRLLNLSPERVSQIESEAIGKLRLALEAVGG
jgi:Sigma-70, region 4